MMRAWTTLTAVAFGSALGAVLRLAAGDLGPDAVLPWSTLLVNGSGSLVMGAFVASVQRRPADRRPGPAVQAGVTAGFCGGLTTFSIFSGETVAMAAAGATGLALAYTGATVLFSLGGAALGFRLVRP